MMKVSGLEKTLKALSKFSGVDIDKAIDDGVVATAYEVRNSAVKSIQQKSSGEVVQRQRQGGEGYYDHTASKPGDAPNTDTGTLVRSVAVEHPFSGEAFVGSDVKYASFLEFGTKTMGARPWLYPALQQNIGNLTDNIEKQVKRRINEL